MSESPAPYAVDAIPATAIAWQNSPYARDKHDPSFVQPPPEIVRAFRRWAGWSQIDAAKIVGVSFNPEKGSTTIRKWETAEGKKEHRPIPFAAWRLMLVYQGVINVKQSAIR